MIPESCFAAGCSAGVACARSGAVASLAALFAAGFNEGASEPLCWATAGVATMPTISTAPKDAEARALTARKEFVIRQTSIGEAIPRSCEAKSLNNLVLRIESLRQSSDICAARNGILDCKPGSNAHRTQ